MSHDESIGFRGIGTALPPRFVPLDSLSILHLLAAVEKLSGCRVPDQLVVMKHFQSLDAITTGFGPSPQDALS